LFLTPDATNSGAPRLLLNFLRLYCQRQLPFIALLCVRRRGDLTRDFELLDIPFYRPPRVIERLEARFPRLSAAMFACWFAGVMMRVRPGILYSNTVTNPLAVIVARLLRARTVVHVHEGPGFLRRSSLGLLLSVRFTSQFVAVSEYCAAGIKRVLGRDAVVVRNWVRPMDLLPGPDKPGASPGRFTLGVVGAINRNKNQQLAILALALLSRAGGCPYRLKLIGLLWDESYCDELRDLARRLGVADSVELVGPRANQAEVYADLDLVIVTSMEETFSLVALEAQALGKPLVAADVGGIREAIFRHDSVVLFTPGDAFGLARAVESLLSSARPGRRASELPDVELLSEERGARQLCDVIGGQVDQRWRSVTKR
jgi:glycosyltransferase involved in cell wall biosynthesis